MGGSSLSGAPMEQETDRLSSTEAILCKAIITSVARSSGNLPTFTMLSKAGQMSFMCRLGDYKEMGGS